MKYWREAITEREDPRPTARGSSHMTLLNCWGLPGYRLYIFLMYGWIILGSWYCLYLLIRV